MERIEETILAYRKRRARRLDERGAEERPDREDYGTKASGNWGHVGRPGERGGSGAGGGASFRFTKGGKKGGYDSKAKLQGRVRAQGKAAKTAVAEAKKSGDSRRIAEADAKMKRYQKRLEKVNMHRKSARDLKAAGRYDPNANKRISKDKIAHEREVANVSGKKTAMKHTFNGTRKEWHKK